MLKRDEAIKVITFLQLDSHDIEESIEILEVALNELKKVKEQHKQLTDIERYKRRGF